MKTLARFSALALVVLVILVGVASAQHSEKKPAPPTVSIGGFEAKMKNDQPPLVIDVRLAEDFDEAPSLIPTAEWKDPKKVDEWSESLPKDREIVVYCVAGKWVSQGAATRLVELGYDASSLEGGVEAWKKSGGTVVPGKR